MNLSFDVLKMHRYMGFFQSSLMFVLKSCFVVFYLSHADNSILHQIRVMMNLAFTCFFGVFFFLE